MSLLVLRVTDAADAEAASDWLWSLGALAIEERSDGPIWLIAGFSSAEAALAVRDVVGERWPTRCETAPDEAEWRDTWLAHLRPVVVDQFVIHPPWRPVDAPAAGQRTISIDPGRAFGSGHHPTTQLAIQLIGQDEPANRRVLDVGCGSGVLSIIAAALGAESVVGLDLNLDIAELARTNAEANGFDESRIRFADEPVASLAARTSDHDDPWDVVVANMTRGNLEPLLPDLVSLAGRSLILSGLLYAQAEPLIASVASSANLSLAASLSADGWTALRFTRA